VSRGQRFPASYPSERMTCWPVSARVGHVKNNDPSDSPCELDVAESRRASVLENRA